jgi:hypothetical protein
MESAVRKSKKSWKVALQIEARPVFSSMGSYIQTPEPITPSLVSQQFAVKDKRGGSLYWAVAGKVLEIHADGMVSFIRPGPFTANRYTQVVNPDKAGPTFFIPPTI